MRPYIGKPVIKVITGMRRVGKSCFLSQLYDELRLKAEGPAHVLLVDMESLEFDGLRDYRSFHGFVEEHFRGLAGTRYLLVDEVQEIDQWERAIVSLAKSGHTDIFLTGSNAHLLSSEIATLLSGRYVEFPLHSLGFAEFLEFRSDKCGDPETEFGNWLRFGGLPAVHHLELADEMVFDYTGSVYSTILLKDIVKRRAVRNVTLLESIGRFLFDNVGNLIAAKPLADYLKSQRLSVGVQTVQNYLSYFDDAFISHKLRRYDLRGKRHLEVYEKHYLEDLGLRHAVLGYRDPDISGLLENVVCLELKRRGYRLSIGRLGNREIDFIAEKANTKVYVQVAYRLATPTTVEREFGVLQAIRDNYPKFVISLDKHIGDDYEGIRCLNLIDFVRGAEL